MSSVQSYTPGPHPQCLTSKVQQLFQRHTSDQCLCSKQWSTWSQTVCGCTLRLSSTLAAVSRSRLWGASSGYVWLYNLYFSEQKRTNPTWTERRCQAYFVPLSSQCQGYSSRLWAAVTELQCQQQDTQCKNHWAKWGISWRPAGFVNVKKKPKLQIRVTRPNNPVRTLWCSSLKWCLDLNPKPEMSFLSAHVPAWVKRRLMWAWEHFSAQCLSVSEQLCGWGLGGKKGLVSILIVKQCHSQNSKWGMGVTVSHFLTLRDKLDIFFMWRGETLFVMIVCRQSWSRVMVFLTIRTVENDLWSRKSERGTREVLCWFLQERKCSLSFPSRNFKWYPISKKGWLSRSKKLQQLNEGPCDPRSHTHEQGQSAWLVQTKNHENPTE